MPDKIHIGSDIRPQPVSQAAQLDGTRFLVLAGLTGLTNGPTQLDRPVSGRDVDAFLAGQFGLDLDRGVYRHLDELTGHGLAEKQPGPGTRNHYTPTREGLDVVRAAANWLQWIVGESQGDDTSR